MALKLIAEIALDGSGFERGLQRMGRSAASSVKSLAVQAFGIYGVEQAIAKTVETASDLVDASQRLDVTVEQLQLLRQAAKDGGTEMSNLASAFEKLDQARAKALAGDKDAMAAFAKLGVTQAQLKTQTAATIFTGSVSSAVKNGNVENLGPVLKEILGKSFGELIPVLKTDFDELGDKMKKLGTIMDTDTAVKLDALGDNFSLLSGIIAVQLGPVLVQVAVLFLEMIGKVKAFGSFIGALSEKGIVKGTATLAREMLDTPVGKLVDITGAGKLIADQIVSEKDRDELMSKSGAAFVETDDAFKKILDGIMAQLAKSADELKNPKPIVPQIDTEKPKAARIATQSDALVRVGNFLGTNGNTISRVDQRKIDLLNKIVENTKPLASFGSGFSFMGIPLV